MKKPKSFGRKPYYAPWSLGDFNRICDRSGFKVKGKDTRKEWNGLIVRTEDWEARQPQDFVRGVEDHQAVPDPRPGGTIDLSSETTLDAAELPGQTVLSVTSTSAMTAGDVIQIDLDNDEMHLSTISSFSAGDTVTIADAIPTKASSGNTVRILKSASL